MDAMDLLRRVAERYRNLRTLFVEANVIAESNHDGGSHRNERPALGFFAAPNQVRGELGKGRHSSTVVTNGRVIHRYHRMPGRYWTAPFTDHDSIPGMFRPEFPAEEMTFLFHRVAENVIQARVTGEDDSGVTVEVEYAVPEQFRGPAAVKPTTFQIGSDDLVRSREVRMSVVHPAFQETVQSTHRVVFKRLIVDEEITPATFEFVPPEGTDNFRNRPGGYVESSEPSGDRYRIHRQQEWVADELTETMELTARGTQLRFERRVEFLESNSSVRVKETVTSPGDTVEREYFVNLKSPTS